MAPQIDFIIFSSEYAAIPKKGITACIESLFGEVFNALFGPGTTLEDNSGFEQKICGATNENPKKLPSEAHAVESSCCWAREETATATFTLALSSGNNIPLGNPH